MNQVTNTDRADSPRRSRWWYVAALVPPAQVLAAIVSLSVVVVAIDAVGAPLDLEPSAIALAAVAVSIPSAALTVLLPVALYLDIGALEAGAQRAWERWEPDRHAYAIAAAGGIFVPGVSVAVAAYYLYQRHVYVGRP